LHSFERKAKRASGEAKKSFSEDKESVCDASSRARKTNQPVGLGTLQILQLSPFNEE